MAANAVGSSSAILATPAAGQSPAGLLYDLQVDPNTPVMDKSQNPLASGYTVSANDKSLTFTSPGAIPAGGAVVMMNVYADVLDPGNYYGAWNSKYGGATTTVTTGSHSTKYSAPSTYDPTYTSSGASVIPTYWPYLALGFNAGCLRFYNGATGSTAWAGTITSSPDSNVFSLTSSGASVRAAQPGGVDLGPSSGSNSVARYFYAAYQPIGTNTLSSTAFSYLTGSWDNPNGGFSYVTINGANYEQVFLGDLFFAVSGGTAGQTATINPAAVTTSLAGNTSFWMEDGTTYCGDASGGATVGTINTSGVTLAISGAVTQPGAVGISGSIAHSNLLFGGSAVAGLHHQQYLRQPVE